MTGFCRLGSGALSVTANGNVIGGYDGIFARNIYGTSLTVTTGPGTTVTGGFQGISARNYGGALTVTANGDVTGTTNYGIYARNIYGTSLTVTTGVGTTVTGGIIGVYARNDGSGALSVNANGDVGDATTTQEGIHARNIYGTSLTVTTGPGSTVKGGYYGISAVNFGTGALAVTVNGDVAGTNADGIFAYNFYSGPIAITVGAKGRVTSNGVTPGDFAIDIYGGPATVTVAGVVNGGAGGAISFNQCGCGSDDRLELQPGAIINGNVFAGPGTDTFALGGAGTANFDVSAIGSGLQYRDFEIFEKDGGSHWTLTGSNTSIPAFAVNGGLLSVNGAMPNTAFTVNGGTLGGSGTIGSFTA